MCLSIQAGCFSGSGGLCGVGGCWRCVKVKLINLVFVSWHCLCLLSAPQSLSNQAAQKSQQLPSNAANCSPGPMHQVSVGCRSRRKVKAHHKFHFSVYQQVHLTFTGNCRTIKTLVCSGVLGMPAEGALPACAGGWWGDSSQRSAWYYCCFRMFNNKGLSSGIQKLWKF